MDELKNRIGEAIEALAAQEAAHQRTKTKAYLDIISHARDLANMYEQGFMSLAKICDSLADDAGAAREDIPHVMGEALFTLKARAIAYPLIAGYFRALGKPGGQPSAGEEPGESHTTRAWALFYHYLHRAGEYPDISNASGRKMEALQEIATAHGIGPVNFYQTFDAIGRNREKNPLRNPDNLKAAIKLLEARKPFNAKALELAKADLEKKK